jgi:hypothetical protein
MVEQGQHRSNADRAQILAANAGVLPEASGELRAHEQMTAASIEPSEAGPREVNLPLRPLDADVSNRS